MAKIVVPRPAASPALAVAPPVRMGTVKLGVPVRRQEIGRLQRNNRLMGRKFVPVR